MSAHGRESCKQPLTPVLLLRTEIEERVFLLPKIKKKKKRSSGQFAMCSSIKVLLLKLWVKAVQSEHPREGMSAKREQWGHSEDA